MRPCASAKWIRPSTTSARTTGSVTPRDSAKMPASSRNSKVPKWLKSCGRHSVIQPSAGPRPSVLSGINSGSGPYGVRQHAANASAVNGSQRSITRGHSLRFSFSSASSPAGPISPSASTTLPCRLAHSTSSGSAQ